MRLSAVHSAGFFRVIAGTLDCLGAVVIGVAAFRTPIPYPLVQAARANAAAVELAGILENVVHMGRPDKG